MPKAGNLNISVIANENTNSDNFPLGPIRQFHRIKYHTNITVIVVAIIVEFEC